MIMYPKQEGETISRLRFLFNLRRKANEMRHGQAKHCTMECVFIILWMIFPFSKCSSFLTFPYNFLLTHIPNVIILRLYTKYAIISRTLILIIFPIILNSVFHLFFIISNQFQIRVIVSFLTNYRINVFLIIALLYYTVSY